MFWISVGSPLLWSIENTAMLSPPANTFRLPADFPAWLESRCPRGGITPLIRHYWAVTPRLKFLSSLNRRQPPLRRRDRTHHCHRPGFIHPHTPSLRQESRA